MTTSTVFHYAATNTFCRTCRVTMTVPGYETTRKWVLIPCDEQGYLSGLTDRELYQAPVNVFPTRQEFEHHVCSLASFRHHAFARIG